MSHNGFGFVSVCDAGELITLGKIKHLREEEPEVSENQQFIKPVVG